MVLYNTTITRVFSMSKVRSHVRGSNKCAECIKENTRL